MPAVDVEALPPVATEVAEAAAARFPRLANPAAAYAIVILGIVTAYLVVHALRPVPAFPYDDPYITLHSAQVLHSGFDRNYPGVPALTGVTSAPFLGLVYLLLFVFAPLQALQAACWIGLLFYALGLIRLARALKLRPREEWLFLFLGLACAPVPIHWFNGLETSCALAAITWTLAFATGDRLGSRWGAALLSGVSTCFRPDLLPFALLITTCVAWNGLRAQPRSKRAWLQVFGFIAATAAPILLCVFWYFHQTGSPIPLTGIAKRYFFAQDHWPLTRKAEVVGNQLILLAAALGPFVLVPQRMAKFAMGKVLLLAMGLFVLALVIQFPNELAVNEFRYPVVLIPALLWGLGATLAQSVSRERRSVERLLYVCAAYAAVMLPVCVHFYNNERLFFESGPRQVTTWCEKNLPPGASILVNDAGYLSYSTGFRTVDFVGLKTPWAIPLNRQYTWPTAGRERAVAVSKVAAESGSRYMILNSHWPPVISLPDDLHALGWRVELLHTAGAFKIYRLTLPPG